ncbi:MAG TPA: glycosyltransferase family 2 protein [Patescibacteria group bacterium]|nr:glycosyltransferase family 2 protein [Patescibacteria group bacterium]
MQKKKKINRKNLDNGEFYGLPKYSTFFYTLLSLIFVFGFAVWWFQPAHIPFNFFGEFRIIDILLFLTVSYIIWQPITMEILTWAISSNIKDIRHQKPMKGSRVAFITTIVPSSEPLDLLHKCLPAMTKASYPHDTWLLDEGDDPNVKEVCRIYGVHYFTRRGREEFNTPNGKFTKTKGGNHNSWYEVYGDNYDFVAQIDTDFVPRKDFLTKTLGYFRDPKVAFVGTPQIYGNTRESIIAKGAAEQLYTFYGSVLKGLSSMKMTLLIGANHIIRVAALRNVDHYSAHITEDLITGMKLHANGWESVYVSEPLAIGEGPATWESYFSQQMRWAYGCMDIFFRHSHKFFKKMGLRRTVYYFFLQQHYFTGLAMALSVILISLYFFAGLRAANVDLYQFFGFYSLTLIICWLMSIFLQRFNVYRKSEGEMLLAGKLISIAAWPVWFLAFITTITGKKLNYKVTPKGENDVKPKKSFGIFIPHILLGLITLSGLTYSLIIGRHNIGMIFWALATIILMFSVPFMEEIASLESFAKRTTVKSAIYVFNLLKKLDNRISIELFKTEARYNYGMGKIRRFSSRKLFLNDYVFLTLVVIISSVLYLNKIRFYSDDWSFLGNFSLSHDQSLWGLIQTATTPNTLMRPVQNFYEALLYWSFGTSPLGYQIVNLSIFVGIVIFFYTVLRQLKIPRILSVAIPLVYVLLPNYSTDRFWFAVHQANLSVLFYFISLFAALKSVSRFTMRKTLWKVISLLTLLLSVLSYEVAIPLFLVNLFILWNPYNLFLRIVYGKRKSNLVFISVIGIFLLYTLIFKAVTTKRLTGGIDIDYIIHVLTAAFHVNYVSWFVNLPYVWGEIISSNTDPILLALTGVIYLFIFYHLYTIASDPDFKFPTLSAMKTLTFASFPVFFLGYVIFFTNNQVGFSPTGVENRVAIAASIGVAMTFVGLAGWLSKIFLPEKAAKVMFCIILSLICAGSFLTVNTIASFWADAGTKSDKILADIHKEFPKVDNQSTILLDGVCPYVGPAPVFEADWDLKGALETYYLKPMNADIVTPRMKVRDNSISTTIYTFTTSYPYKNMYIYNYKTKQIYKINNSDEAHQYFNTYNKDLNNGCPNAEAGKGVAIFKLI